MASELPRPPFDPELKVLMDKMGVNAPTYTIEDIPEIRKSFTPGVESVTQGVPVEHEERKIPGPGGDLMVSIFRKSSAESTTSPPTQSATLSSRPGFYHIHGGGMFTGTRFFGVRKFLDWVIEMDAVLVSIEYRLPPEHPDPAPIEDCYAGLTWMAEHASELGFDPDNLVIVGGSAGAGLAAGTTLMSRDRSGPALRAQLLECPMLDDRNDTLSARQFETGGTWTRGSNLTGWTCLLGDRRGGDDVSIYAAPARATDLSGLPPAFISVGSAEVFRDEDVAYASKIWACGGQTELHVWPGGFHGSTQFMKDAQISKDHNATRTAWMRRVVGTKKFD
jgi:acetyl esterase/lipase